MSQVTGLSDTELGKVARGLIDYFNSSEEYIHVTVIKNGQPFTVFNQREQLHLKDVKAMLQMDYRVLFGTLGYALIFAGVYLFRRKEAARRQFARSVFIASIITLSVLLVLAVGRYFDFDQLFLEFHFLSFSNDLWILDPTKDYLIMLFPLGFFYDWVFYTGIVTTILALVLGAGSGIYLRRNRKTTASAG